jgi:hypothetical protein
MSYENRFTLPRMGLKRKTMKSDEVRAPAVPRGTAVIVTRYREDVAKAALVSPQDLAMLAESHDVLQTLAQLQPLPLCAAALKALRLEDRPDRAARERS